MKFPSFAILVKVVIIYLFIISNFSSFAWGDESLLLSKRKLNVVERKAAAKETLEMLKQYDLSVPTLTPKEREYVSEELKILRGNLYSERGKSFINSREYIIWSFRQDLDEAIRILNLIIDEQLSKNNEMKAWSFVIMKLINGRIDGNYDAGRARGYFSKDFGYHSLLRFHYMKILEKMVIEQLD